MHRLNLQIVIEIICFSLFGGLLIYFVLTGQYVNYVNPRLLPFLWITVVLFFLWIINRLRYVFRKTHRNQLTHCFSILLPFILFVVPLGTIKSATLPNDYVDSSQVANYIGSSSSTTSKTVVAQKEAESDEVNPSADEETSVSSSINSTIENEGSNNSSNNSIDSDTTSSESSNPDNNDTSTENEDSTVSDNLRLSAPFIIDGLNDKEKQINVKDNYFLLWLSEISSNIDMYIGYTITIKGFVYEDNTLLDEGDLSISRLLMSCCTADLVPIGLLSTHKLDYNILVDQWYLFTGVITTKQFRGEMVPYVQIKEAISSSKPTVEYIYP